MLIIVINVKLATKSNFVVVDCLAFRRPVCLYSSYDQRHSPIKLFLIRMNKLSVRVLNLGVRFKMELSSSLTCRYYCGNNTGSLTIIKIEYFSFHHKEQK